MVVGGHTVRHVRITAESVVTGSMVSVCQPPPGAGLGYR